MITLVAIALIGYVCWLGWRRGAARNWRVMLASVAFLLACALICGLISDSKNDSHLGGLMGAIMSLMTLILSGAYALGGLIAFGLALHRKRPAQSWGRATCGCAGSRGLGGVRQRVDLGRWARPVHADHRPIASICWEIPPPRPGLCTAHRAQVLRAPIDA